MTIFVDPDRLRQVLVNLLANAVKFTPAGGRVFFSCARQGARVELVIRDTGIGIPADRLQSIFEPFVQIEDPASASHQGTGLGLAISRDLVRGMGGRLTVESELGKGSTFTVSFPALG